ncbi:related to Guanyl-specific ribonuclease F1 [Cephalotrichum gorgonifer]|uniref:ribonuclease T1 n=1 Tax=Cephalotrichum gorgonifer TaxID=2041049 RepID=A0AAE8SX08_9PEZI|nr:related to Guanyl-specific ribonuclease F1 [Cephalotrichum gorgonifer]
MVSLKTIVFASLAALAAANPIGLEKRQGTGGITSVTCGSNRYTVSQLNAATSRGCQLYASGQTVGSNNYPHTFNNREGLPLETSGPYQEFPILKSGSVYNGGSPSTDRIVFNPSYNGACVYVGAITHTGASGNNFVSCRTT